MVLFISGPEIVFILFIIVLFFGSDKLPEIARGLLKQEEFDSYMLVNVVGGKSWKVDDYFIGENPVDKIKT